jgi:hypothetical protein
MRWLVLLAAAALLEACATRPVDCQGSLRPINSSALQSAGSP